MTTPDQYLTVIYILIGLILVIAALVLWQYSELRRMEIRSQAAFKRYRKVTDELDTLKASSSIVVDPTVTSVMVLMKRKENLPAYMYQFTVPPEQLFTTMPSEVHIHADAPFGDASGKSRNTGPSMTDPSKATSDVDDTQKFNLIEGLD